MVFSALRTSQIPSRDSAESWLWAHRGQVWFWEPSSSSTCDRRGSLKQCFEKIVMLVKIRRNGKEKKRLTWGPRDGQLELWNVLSVSWAFFYLYPIKHWHPSSCEVAERRHYDHWPASVACAYECRHQVQGIGIRKYAYACILFINKLQFSGSLLINLSPITFFWARPSGFP